MTRTTHTTALLTLCLSGSISCAGGGLGGLFASVDDTCIAGKLTTEGAMVLNGDTLLVNAHGDYMERWKGYREGDRVLGRHCAEGVRALSGLLADAVDGD